MKKQPTKSFWEMTSAERTEAVKQFDKPIPPSKMKRLTKAQRERFERARSGPTGSIFATAVKKKKVTLKLSETLLARMDRLAEQRGITRDQIVERSIFSALMFTS